jgi:hypothetical protein
MSENLGAAQVHQALHGYRDGHQLLASSLELSQEQQWQMLVMTDLSGPSFRSGFDGYLTGYPLDGGGFYCFSRTWFAPEMPRPGCVWTHTLLIRDADIARVRDIRSLSTYFRRPGSAIEPEGYDEEVELDIAAQPYPMALDFRSACALIGMLYGSPGTDVILTADAGAAYEDTGSVTTLRATA